MRGLAKKSGATHAGLAKSTKKSKKAPKSTMDAEATRVDREREAPDADAEPVDDEVESSDNESDAGGEESEAEAEAEAESESEAEAEDEAEDEGKTPEQLQKAATTRRRKKSKQRGYRSIAKKAGCASKYVATRASRNATASILSVSEVIRAAKWTPGMPNRAVFEDLGEFRERSRIAAEPFPRSAAAAAVPSVEVFARELMNRAVELMLDQKKTRVTSQIMHTACRPLQRAMRYPFAIPHGLVRHAQSAKATPDGPAIGLNAEDEAQMENERAHVFKSQKRCLAELQKEQDARKASRKSTPVVDAAA